jgi:hypothetical protein
MASSIPKPNGSTLFYQNSKFGVCCTMINVSCVRAVDQWAFWGKIWKNHWSLFSGTPPITATSTNPGLWLPPTFNEARKLSLWSRSSSSAVVGFERALTWKATAPQQWPRFAGRSNRPSFGWKVQTCSKPMVTLKLPDDEQEMPRDEEIKWLFP